MDDYYELLGVSEDADVDDIRAAYRDKRAEALEVDDNPKNKNKERDAERGRAEAAALNKAWNVLSDPYQRGRYDQQRASGELDVDDDDEYEDDEEDAAPVAKRPAAKSSSKTQTKAEMRREARMNMTPTVKLPAGMAFPSTRRRIIAMFIDIAVLLVFFIGSQFIVVSMNKSQHRAAYDRVSELNKTDIPEAKDAASDAKKTAGAAEDEYNGLLESKGANAQETKDAKAKWDEKQQIADDKKAAEKKLNDELTKNQNVLAPVQNLVTGIFFLVALLVLMVPSMFGGQTLGKRLQRIRVTKIDGSRAGWKEILQRYTLLVFAAYVLATFLRSPIGALIVVFVATLWTRNPNQQGLQDRFAKTLVLADAEEAEPA